MIDLTLPLAEGMPGFPGYPGFKAERLETHAEDGKVSRRFCTTTHHGTHVDAPAHFIEGGATIDEVPPDALVGPARVIDLREERGGRVDDGALASAAPELAAGERVILVTGDVDARFYDGDFFDEAAVLTATGAEWLVKRGVRSVANDFLTESIDGPERPVHRALLGAGIPIVEYLRNTDAIADAGTVEFACLPLKAAGFEAAPARAVVRP